MIPIKRKKVTEPETNDKRSYSIRDHTNQPQYIAQKSFRIQHSVRFYHAVGFPYPNFADYLGKKCEPSLL